MPRGNPSPKMAITVDPDVHAGVAAAAAAEGVERFRMDDRSGATRAARA